MTPALAVISELRKRGYDNFVWVGHKHNQFGSSTESPEYRLVSEQGIKFIDLPAGKLTRNWGSEFKAGVINLLKVPYGFVKGFWVVLRERPALVMSFGGYIALPVAIAARLTGRRVITHEQTAVTGLTNKVLPYFANKVLISWPSSAKYYPKQKTVLTGNPIRPEILQPNSHSFHFDNDLPVLFVTGGNQGSHKINQAVFASLEKLLEICNVIHQTGNSSVTRDWEEARSRKTSLPKDLQGRYIPRDFIGTGEFGEVFARADLIVARSGANTTYEILALGKRAIFIPIPWVTHNEQFMNAQIAADTGLAVILPENELSAASLYDKIRQGLYLHKEGHDYKGLEFASAVATARKLVIPDAAVQIADQIELLIRKR
ncbi:UDP-N-acetylglucosamine--N-acetylmuramyl-(pentapeptide) pyrophosphoryl-undecaprenol N-acetylglucosamine transferase [Candidatus Dojkabacteria bacterium]|uniref:UDP-N-acetylglucosamine--N-acetylmuramyl-(pentapeptide) pyrophosphoryl-undecaprenol N-acetylglucosamine transferase n=1 Tax=Candidatus Dojkabacteria bacterium TaxID=2099670 RepID=A0A955IA26_9BACT|nr:UDP-N-acetylglucosamine--N-acetylmuramyl-(pentapeptide) pyrophosphoryl-undecaprenol N-acetylglucosamine transferase [Candidatus Dojkabacteria bacterium]